MTTLKKGCRSAMAALTMLTALTGCRSTSPRYIPMETTVIRTDTLRQTEIILRTDSIRHTERIYETRLDSIAPILDSTGRMVGFDRWHIIDRSTSLNESNRQLLARLDSIRQQSNASLYVSEPYPVEIPSTTNILRWWQKVLIGIGLLSLIFLLLLAGGLLLSRKLRENKSTSLL